MKEIAAKYDLIVVGGGPAGTAAAITAARAGAKVLLLERGRLPRQKVCGEFVSAEGVQTLRELDGALADHLLVSAPRIARSRLFLDGKIIEVPIHPEAASITRYELDLCLWQSAIKAGAECRQDSEVLAICEANTTLALTIKSDPNQLSRPVMARAVIDAAGRWSRLRGGGTTSTVSARRGRCMALKAHFKSVDSAPPTVDLYFYREGYCGVQPVGHGRVNACAMVQSGTAKTLPEVFAMHPALAARAREWTRMGKEFATSPLVFAKPLPVRGRVLCAGDAAGFVDPFIGDGITLALRSGRLAAEAVLRGDAGWYERQYQKTLAPVFANASWLRRLMGLPDLLRKPIIAALRAPGVGQFVVGATRAR